MRCPQCAVDQPLGVTVCGFCGAVMVRGAPALRPADADQLLRGAAQASQVARGARRWAALIGAALAIGVAVGWGVMRLGAEPAADASAVATKSEDEESSDTGVEPPADLETDAAAPSLVERGSLVARLDETALTRFGEELARLAEAGDAAGLAARVDPRLRYRLRVDDGAEERSLRGGKPELLAHWLAPWLAYELHGVWLDSTVEVERVALELDQRRGLVVRRLRGAGDVSRLRFPRALLEPLGLRGALDLDQAGRVDLAPLTAAAAACSSVEMVRVAAGPTGARVVEVERSGSCRPAR